MATKERKEKLKQDLRRDCGDQVKKIIDCRRECSAKGIDFKIACTGAAMEIADCAAHVYCKKESDSMIQRCRILATSDECLNAKRNLQECFENAGLPVSPMQ